ncbi:hypothetical protein RGQ29_009331 [Quercus rubra]|uniref:O-fucosyltransferase family protein n=1 Tax=Quercus rubra TaxID=3512 RepID=A0AAN7J5M4_QUERU|nr:hypothetical protein RGQ29_009331 [Quercus rubra]
MQKRRWRWISLNLLRKLLMYAVCMIALVALFSVHLFPSSSSIKVPNFSDAFKLPTQHELKHQSWTRELTPPHLSKGKDPLSSHSRQLVGAREISDYDKLWKRSSNSKFEPCIEPSANYTSPGESRGYLLVHANGGLNQMRFGICDMVAVARIINATLVIPELDKKSFWQDNSHFSDVFDEDHFINVLANDVRVVKKLPKELATASKSKKEFRSWSGVEYYEEEITNSWLNHQIIQASKSDSRLANNYLPLDIQKLRCRACYEALRFAPRIEAMGKLLVDRMRSYGPYIALHLRFEKDMLAFSGCTQELSPAEAEELRMLRNNTDNWKIKDIDSKEQRSKGECPLTPKEEKLATVEELQPFINHGSQLAALDYIVSVESDVFIPSYSGNMAKAVEGHRRFLGHRKTIVPLRKTIVRLFDKLENATLKERKKISSQIIDAHIKRQGSPRKRKGPISGTRGMDRFRSEESFYTNPKPECLCQRETPNANTSHIIR